MDSTAKEEAVWYGNELRDLLAELLNNAALLMHLNLQVHLPSIGHLNYPILHPIFKHIDVEFTSMMPRRYAKYWSCMYALMNS